jgi:uncharacterized protein with HEPN domain
VIAVLEEHRDDVVALCQRFIHRYSAVDDRLVWEAATDRIPNLIVVLDRSLVDPS